ncbi:LANO_0F16930g1_1 [Lachancea nothofagi CBS 11611]|uniref:LANO_0F16930g1_1 n=1 Tax=Lachancea nothofagi CBS 11611 TaxID=1266666 RepID=A0A1G4KDB8_9SACH|nr:LANO_0F16930g1_1 [Lachancea nothofagi CBS 11611]
MGKTKVIRSVIEGLDYYCRKTDSQTLKKLAFSVGSPIGTTKTSLRDNIVAQCQLLHNLTTIKREHGWISITAVDMGLENFAYCKLQWRTDQTLPTVVEWNKMQLQGPVLNSGVSKIPFTPRFMAEAGQRLTDILTKDPPHLFVIERQRTRTMGSAKVPDPILKVNALEHVLYMSLSAKKLYVKGFEYMVESSDPRRMTNFWCQLVPVKEVLDSKYGPDSPKARLKATSSTLTKMLKIGLVKSLLLQQSPQAFTLTSELEQKLTSYRHKNPQKKLDLFQFLDLGDGAGKPKEDDLADSLLHGVAWLKWLKTFEELKEVIMTSDTADTGLEAFNNFNKAKRIESEQFFRSCITEL